MKIYVFLIITLFFCSQELKAQVKVQKTTENKIDILGSQNSAILSVSSSENRSVSAGWGEGSSWMDQANKINAMVEGKQIDLVFLGNSITQSWGSEERNVWGPGKEIWNEYYKNRNAANFGISGDRTQHILWRIENGCFDEIRPKLIVLHIGTNNMNDNSVEEIAEGIKTILQLLKQKTPTSKILLLGIFPRGEFPNDPLRIKANKVNKMIKSFSDDQAIFYKDIKLAFLTADGKGDPTKMSADFLHLKKEGYRAWAEAIEPDIKLFLDHKSKL